MLSRRVGLAVYGARVSTAPAELARFLEAQDERATYAQALSELRAGHKSSHWMWFVFPQISGLGHSAMSRRYAIASLREAEEYLHHPILGPRLIECTKVVLELKDLTAEQIFGAIDAIKLRSCITLFAQADPSNALFTQALERYFEGTMDAATLRRLAELEQEADR
jgi:uncharacterized protein (DUF1810 family)